VQDPSKFKARVVGTLKEQIQRPKKAAEIYVNLYAARGVPGNWHELAKRLIPDYAGLIGRDAEISPLPAESPIMVGYRVDLRSGSLPRRQFSISGPRTEFLRCIRALTPETFMRHQQIQN